MNHPPQCMCAIFISHIHSTISQSHPSTSKLPTLPSCSSMPCVDTFMTLARHCRLGPPRPSSPVADYEHHVT